MGARLPVAVHQPQRSAEVRDSGDGVTRVASRQGNERRHRLRDRQSEELGLFLEMNITANVAAARLDLFGSIWLNERKQVDVASTYVKKLGIGTPGVGQRVLHLSGGNQQKVVLSKWLLRNRTS
ncbi:MAG: hypothetical protein WKF37_11020 [Bryobacteraceae bacterium]